jgi:hypothetical protein
LGHCFMAVTYLNCNLHFLNAKSWSLGGYEIFMKIF